jgi:outer membrane putative beta-barrel porin/alpha-amylase
MAFTCVALALFGPTRATRAQQQSVSEVLTFLVTNQSVATGDFERDRAAAQATSDTISRALLASLATLPITASSGAFVYRLNPQLGTVERATHSFGPFFVERAMATGTGRSSFALTFQHMRFTSLDGHNLRDGSLVTTANQFVDEAAPFDVDQLILNIDASVAALHGTFGVTSRLDVGFVAPMVALRLNGSRVNTYRGRAFTQATASATATGLADLVVRTKYTLFDEDGAGLAAAVDVRLPTGKREDLLGAGSTSVRFSGIGSIEDGRLSGHANAGLSLGGLARELSYAGAAAFAASDRVTITGELLGRWIDSPGGIMPVSADSPNLIGARATRLLPGSSTLNILTLLPGVKWNLSDTWVLGGSVSIPLTTAGLTSRFTPFVGLDYAF